MSIADRSKVEAASAHVWKTVNRDRSSYHNDVTDYTDQESSEKITDVILVAMLGILQGQLNKRSADLNAVVDRTRTQIDKELTP